MTEQETKAAAEPPLDCNVGLREAVDEIMQYQFSHSQDAMSALQRLVDAAEAGASEIDRLQAELYVWRQMGRSLHDAGLRVVDVPNAPKLTGRGTGPND